MEGEGVPIGVIGYSQFFALLFGPCKSLLFNQFPLFLVLQESLLEQSTNLPMVKERGGRQRNKPKKKREREREEEKERGRDAGEVGKIPPK